MSAWVWGPAVWAESWWLWRQRLWEQLHLCGRHQQLHLHLPSELQRYQLKPFKPVCKRIQNLSDSLLHVLSHFALFVCLSLTTMRPFHWQDCANCIYIPQPQLRWLRKHKETKIIYMLRLVVGSFTKQTSFWQKSLLGVFKVQLLLKLSVHFHFRSAKCRPVAPLLLFSLLFLKIGSATAPSGPCHYNGIPLCHLPERVQFV